MKLISLNTEGASQGKTFYDYISGLAPEADIFCFQEVLSSVGKAADAEGRGRVLQFQKLTELLPDFAGFFDAKSSGYTNDSIDKIVSWPVNSGLAVFVRNTLAVRQYSARIIGDGVAAGGPPLEGLLKTQIVTLGVLSGVLHIINIHGLSRPGSKLDTPERLAQSQRLLEILESLSDAPVVLCGDFNLMPETESVRMLESKLPNLIAKFGITNTRNEISWKRYGNRQSFADYTFVSPGVNVKHFEVPYNLVSDHLPMVLEFSL